MQEYFNTDLPAETPMDGRFTANLTIHDLYDDIDKSEDKPLPFQFLPRSVQCEFYENLDNLHRVIETKKVSSNEGDSLIPFRFEKSHEHYTIRPSQKVKDCASNMTYEDPDLTKYSTLSNRSILSISLLHRHQFYENYIRPLLLECSLQDSMYTTTLASHLSYLYRSAVIKFRSAEFSRIDQSTLHMFSTLELDDRDTFFICVVFSIDVEPRQHGVFDYLTKKHNGYIKSLKETEQHDLLLNYPIQYLGYCYFTCDCIS